MAATNKIELMICGAQKAGTTSLLHYLNAHQQIIKQLVKEFAYFVLDDMYESGYKSAFEKYFEAPQKNNKKVVAKSVGIMYMPKAIKRLYEHNAKTHIVLLLRNPVERAYSNYFYALRKGDETILSFEQAIEAEPRRLREDANLWRNCAYLDRGIYCKSIEEFLKYFPKNQLHIYLFEDFKKDPEKICKEIFSILGLENDVAIDYQKKHNEKAMAKSSFLAKATGNNSRIKKIIKTFIGTKLRKSLKGKIQKMNETTFDQPAMNAETRKKLIEFYLPFNQELGALTGLNISNWNK